MSWFARFRKPAVKVVTVNVTMDHIRRGVREGIGTCPVALALREAGFRDTIVASRAIYGPDERTALPPAAAKFIERFDQGQEVKPFSFQITVPA